MNSDGVMAAIKKAVGDIPPRHAVDRDATVTLGELRDLYEEIDSSDVGDVGMIDIDGARLDTDWGYGIEAIGFFVEVLERRHGANLLRVQDGQSD